MFTNEFGQTVVADCVTFSVSKEQMTQFATTVVRSIVRDSSVDGVVSIMDNDSDVYTSGFYCTGVKEEHVDAFEEALGLKVDSLEDGECFFDDGAGAFGRILRLLFGETAKYDYDEDGDYIISLGYDEYMKKSLGL